MMIRINLLPGEKTGPKRAYTQLALMVAMLIMSGVIVSFLWIDINNTIAEKEREIQDKKRIVKKLEETIKKVKELEEKRTTAKQKLDIITDSKRNQYLPVRMMMALLRVLPEDVWLTNLEIGANGVISAQGYALSYNIIGDFMTAIDAARPFVDPNLASAVKNQISNREVVLFRMTFRPDIAGLTEDL